MVLKPDSDVGEHDDLLSPAVTNRVGSQPPSAQVERFDLTFIEGVVKAL